MATVPNGLGTTYHPSSADYFTINQLLQDLGASAPAQSPAPSSDAGPQVGTSGDDILWGGSGSDVIESGDGNDAVDGGDGNDIIDGGAGNDASQGQAGSDTLLGGDGNDVVDGGAGDDILEGGAGGDMIIGGAGDDAMTGGAGNDVFVISDGSGHDVITDFHSGDILQITSHINDLNLSSPSDLIPLIGTDASGNAVISFGADHAVTLHGISAEELVNNLNSYIQII